MSTPSPVPSPRPAGYVSDVRALVGHRLLLLPPVSVHVRDDAGRLLLVHQVDRRQWGTVGGAVEPGESPAEAAIREAREETGLEVELTGPVAALGGPEFEMTYPNGDECAYISIVFDARVTGGELAADISAVSRSVLNAVGALPADPRTSVE